MVNNEQLEAELFAWKQQRLESGKFPCKCGHFESSHIKRICIMCHGEDDCNIVSYNSPDLDLQYGNCFHGFEPMDNLSIIEWIAANRNDIEK
jgi:hypothetical protein